MTTAKYRKVFDIGLQNTFVYRWNFFLRSLFGLVPAFRATHLAPAAAMRGAGRGITAGRERFSLRRALVATQVALSLVLLVGALLFVRSLRNLLAVDAGFQAEGVLSVSLDLRRLDYPKKRLPVVYRELLERLSSIANDSPRHSRCKVRLIDCSTSLRDAGWGTPCS